eukprot:PhF_6_TR40823/c0_g1_i1/m.61768/K17545/ULK4; serine/threonine-protein kinase ULK4
MNNYQIYEEIGKGQYCTVYKGRKKKSIDYFAVMSVEKSQRPRVLSEVQVLHTITHTNLVQFYNWYETNNHLWLILEYCPGGDLSQVLKQDKKFPEDTVRAFGRDLVAAVQHVHSKGVIHCDMKPSNVLVDGGGFLKLRGFGRCLTVDKPTLEKSSERRGTVPYMAPELFRDEAMYSHKSDIWSLGCVLYELASGRCPWSDPNIPDLIQQITSSPQERIQTCSAELNDLIDGMLQKDPLDRISWEQICAHEFWKDKLPHVPPAAHPDWDAYVQKRQEERKARPNSEETQRRREEVQRVSLTVESAERERRNVTRVLSREDNGGGGEGNSKRAVKSGIPIESILFHTTDSSIKPIIFNPKIERENDNKFDAKDLGFAPKSVEEVKKMEKPDFDTFVKDCSAMMFSPTTQHVQLQALIAYLESISGDSQMANAWVNGTMMISLLRLSEKKDLPSPVRARVCTCMALLIRHATAVTSDLAKQGIWNALLAVLREDKAVKVRRRVLACIGEVLFYVATQTPEERKLWAFDAKTFVPVYLTEASGLDDEIAIHYFLRTMENLTGNNDTELGVKFVTKVSVQFLWSVFTSDRIRSETVKLSAISTLSRACRIHAEGIVWFLEVCPMDTWFTLIGNTNSRTAQYVINVVNVVVCKVLALLNSQSHELISKLVIRDPRQSSPTIFEACSISESLPSLLALNAPKICQAIIEILEQSITVTKSKCILCFALMFAIDPTNVAVSFDLRLPMILERTIVKEPEVTIMNAYSIMIDVLRGLIHIALSNASASALRAVAHTITTPYLRNDVLTDSTVHLLTRCLLSMENHFTNEADVRHVFLIAEALSQDGVTIKKYSALFATQFLPSLVRTMTRDVTTIGDVRFLGLKMAIDVLTIFLSDAALYAEVKSKIDVTVQKLTETLGALLIDEEPIPLYALKLINVVSTYDNTFLAELHKKGITKVLLDFFSLDNKNNNIHNVTVIQRALRTEALPLDLALQWELVPKFTAVFDYAFENHLDAFMEGCIEVMRSCLLVGQKRKQLTSFAPWACHVPALLDIVRNTELNLMEPSSHVLSLLATAFPSTHAKIISNIDALTDALDGMATLDGLKNVLTVLAQVTATDPAVVRGNDMLMLHMERLASHGNESISSSATSLLAIL